MNPKQSPGLGYKRVMSCKDSFHGTDVLAVSEHGAPGRRPNIHAHFVGRQRDGLDTTAGPRRRGKPKHSHRGHPVPGPGNVAAKRCVVPDDLERGTRRFRPAVAPEASDSELQLEFDRFPIRPLSISAGTDLLASPRHGLSRAGCG